MSNTPLIPNQALQAWVNTVCPPGIEMVPVSIHDMPTLELRLPPSPWYTVIAVLCGAVFILAATIIGVKLGERRAWQMMAAPICDPAVRACPK